MAFYSDEREKVMVAPTAFWYILLLKCHLRQPTLILLMSESKRLI